LRHFLAYGNSDQASFRDLRVRESMDFLTVPGTIAAYYPDATAGFVLSSGLKYVIDPRTPLFQNRIDEPKASHFALSEWLGPRIQAVMAQSPGHLVEFRPDLFDSSLVRQIVESVLHAQARYGDRAAALDERLQRYRRLLAEALPHESQVAAQPQPAPPPSFTLAPYFAASSPNDPWWRVNRLVWEACAGRSDVSLVLSVGSTESLGQAIGEVPNDVSDALFYWITGLDERHASQGTLETLAHVVRDNSGGRRLIALYGGFFSIAMHWAGLWGMNNGLGYSESRSWPDLASTGAAPPRYYVRGLHTYLAPATAQLLLDEEPYFRCDCESCTGAPEGSILTLDYHALKRHFAIARKWEIQSVESTSPEGVAQQLREALDRLEALRSRLPARLLPGIGFLRVWAAALEVMT
jgi:hypothetical protein